MEDLHRFLAYQKRFDVKQKQACVVTHEIFDLLTGGDTKSPVFHAPEGPVIDESRKELAIEILGGHKNTALVIL